MADADERWTAVAEHVAEAMTAQAMSQAELVRRSGVSEWTVRKVMRGTPGSHRPDRLRKIARALGWSADSIERVLDGGEPLVLEAATDSDVIVELRRQVVDSAEVAEQALEVAKAALAEAGRMGAELAELRQGLRADVDERLSRGLDHRAPSEAPPVERRRQA